MDSPPRGTDHGYDPAEAADLGLESPRAGYDPTTLCCAETPSPGPGAYGHPAPPLGHIRALLSREYRSEAQRGADSRGSGGGGGGLNLAAFSTGLLRSRPELPREYDSAYGAAPERNLLTHGYRRARLETPAAAREQAAAAAVYDFGGVPSPERLATPPGRWPA